MVQVVVWKGRFIKWKINFELRCQYREILTKSWSDSVHVKSEANFEIIEKECFCFFVFNQGGIKPRLSPKKGVKPRPFLLAWVTNVSTSPDLYIEFSASTLGLVEIFRI